MGRPGARIAIGGWTIDTLDDPHTELVAVEVERALDSPLGRCRVELFVAPAAEPSLLEQAAGEVAGALGLGGEEAGSSRFSTTVRGQTIAHGDPMSIELAQDDRSASVMTATVSRVGNRAGRVVIDGRGSLGGLAATRQNAIHQNKDLSAIARDLAGAAGVAVGQIDASDTYPYIVIHSGRTALDHLLALARLEGMSLFEDGAGKLQLRRFESTAADRTLHFGIDLLGGQVVHAVSAVGAVSVTGESPTSAKGSSRWHHLLKDPAGAQASLGDGSPALALSNATARSTDAAERLARATLDAATAAATHGTLRLLGDPTVEPGLNLEVADAPWPDLNGVFRVVRLRHRISKRDGFTTTVQVSGVGGGGGGATSLLGAAAAAVGL